MSNQDFENIKNFLGEKNSILCLLNKYHPVIAKEIIRDLDIRFDESVMCAVIYSDLKNKTSNNKTSNNSNSPSGFGGGSINVNLLKKYLYNEIVQTYKKIKKETNSSEKEKNKKIKNLINGANIKGISLRSGSSNDKNKKIRDYLNSRNNKRPPGTGGMVALGTNKKSGNQSSFMGKNRDEEMIVNSVDGKKQNIEKILKELKNKKTIQEAIEVLLSHKNIIKILYLILLEINNDDGNKNASEKEMIKYIMNDIKQEGSFTSQLLDEDVLIENFVNKVNKHLSNSNKVSKKDIGNIMRQRENQNNNKQKVALNSSYELKNKNRYEYYLESIRNKK